MQREGLACKILEAENGLAGVKNTRRCGPWGMVAGRDGRMVGEKGQQAVLARTVDHRRSLASISGAACGDTRLFVVCVIHIIHV